MALIHSRMNVLIVEVQRKKVTRNNAINVLILSQLRKVPKLFESAFNFFSC